MEPGSEEEKVEEDRREDYREKHLHARGYMSPAGARELSIDFNDAGTPFSESSENKENQTFRLTALKRMEGIKMAEYKKDLDAISRLSPEQFRVTQQSATERPFYNEFWDHKEPGIYVDIVSGEPLFSSLDKFDSDCGWPSFAKPLSPENIEELHDSSHGMIRTEVRSANADSHLGHVFDDGPKELGGMRYCINSAALRFIPVDELESEGYGEYLKLFDHQSKES